MRWNDICCRDVPQSSQDDRSSLDTFPPGHLAQSSEELWSNASVPRSLRYFPPGHKVHELEPEYFEYLPTPLRPNCADLARRLQISNRASHTKSCTLTIRLRCICRHRWGGQLVMPGCCQNLHAETYHVMHADDDLSASSGEYFPASHSTHETFKGPFTM